MASMKRYKTKYAGVYFIVTKDGEKVYYCRYRKNGKAVDEKVGHQHSDDMTPAKASGIRSDRMHGKEMSNAEKRQEQAQKAVEWTINALWREYSLTLNQNNRSDACRWKNYLEKPFGKKRPKDLVKLDTERIRINLSKKLSAQTVKHILSLLRRIINHGVTMGYVTPLSFKITMPRVDNIKTEDLTPSQLKRLLKELDKTSHKTAAAVMRFALFTGMRKGEILKLKWSDIDMHRRFIWIRHSKGGKSQKIPLNTSVRDVIKGVQRTDAEYLFPSPRSKTGHITNIDKPVRKIKETARLPAHFRPMHGLRHLFASTLASSGKVDMYVLQKLLTHKTPEMTQRYSHLRDSALREASNTIDDIFAELGS